ncbi:hypothetical protein ACHAW5_007756 [Stephanodiscus triporus]|uniref:Methyltransferase FkbM domain-containing protein n=1 Tax=Stephanodiscus triporus TaxID=2934178 RepID=A0ABD3PP51_9STRA
MKAHQEKKTLRASAQFSFTQILLLINLILISWVLLTFSKSASAGIKKTLNLEAKSILPLVGFGDNLRNKPSTYHHAGRTSFTTAMDLNLVPNDCLELLDSHRKLEISQLKNHTDDKPHHKSYLRLTNTKIPFYLSTNDEKVDYVRKDFLFMQSMSLEMQSILEEVTTEMKANGNLKRPIMLDIGGNVGWFSMLSAAHGAEVFVFEPNVVNMVRLCESSVLNGWSISPNPEHNQVHPFLKGVGDVHGLQEEMFAIDGSNPGSFSFSQEAGEQAGAKRAAGGALQLVTLDALAQDQNWLGDNKAGTATIAILKIDVEGLELKVLLGAKKLLRSQKVRYIFMEWKKTLKSQNWEDMCSILLDYGYELFKTGTWLGPSDVVTVKYGSVAELVAYVKSRYEASDINVLFRLASSNEKNERS